MPFALGDYVTANVYFPASMKLGANADQQPAVVWLHPFGYSTGYAYAAESLHVRTYNGASLAKGAGGGMACVTCVNVLSPAWALLGV